jgi:hypothetical protein
MDTGTLSGVNLPGRGVDHPTSSGADVKERVELYLFSHSGPSWSVLGQTLPCLSLVKTGAGPKPETFCKEAGYVSRQSDTFTCRMTEKS